MPQKKKQITWVQGALDDLAELRKAQLKKHPNAMQYFAKIIQNMVKQISESPHLGNLAADLPEYLDYSLQRGAQKLLLRYRIAQKKIYIIHVRYYEDDYFFEYN